MSYTNTVAITEDAIADIRKQYMVMKLERDAAVQEAEKLVRLSEAMKENFDILLAENESLRQTVQQKELRIKQLEQRILKSKKKGRNRLDEPD